MQDDEDRVLIRPYGEGGDPYRLPEGDREEPPPAVEAVTAEVHTVPTPLPGAPTGHAAPPDNDRRQMMWLIGSGLALVVAVVVTMIALWPGADEEQSSAADPPAALDGPGATPQAPEPAAPSAGSAPARTSPSASRSTVGSPSASAPGGTASRNPPVVPPPGQAPVVPPSPTLDPPPAADRTGPITGGGDCLDIDAGVILLGDNLAHRDCNGTPSQRWTLATDGTLRVSGSCATSAGGEVRLQGCGAGDPFQWRAGPGGSLVNIGSGQCLTRTSEDAQVGLAKCGAGGQSWGLP